MTSLLTCLQTGDVTAPVIRLSALERTETNRIAA